MTFHVSKKTLKIIKERYKVGIHLKNWYVDGIHKKQSFWYMEQYKRVSVYDWYTKVIEKFETKNYSIQSAIQKLWYMSGIQDKKSCMKS